MANKVTTEWFDIHVKLGNYLPLEKQKSLQEEQEQMKAAHEEANSLENKLNNMNEGQLKEAADQFDDEDEFTRNYMAKRKAEIIQKVKKGKYGQVIEISRQEYIREVTEADPQSFVVLHLYSTANQFCELINVCLPKIAENYAHVKWIKIIGNKCIENFPDSQCPCFIIYKAGKPVAQLANVDKKLNYNMLNMGVLLASFGIEPL